MNHVLTISLLFVFGIFVLYGDNVFAIDEEPLLVFPMGPFLSNVSYVAVDSDKNIYATLGSNEVIKISPSGQQLLKFGTLGSDPGQFQGVIGIAIDSEGNIFVTDSEKVQKFDSTGNFLSQIGTFGTGDGEFSSPWGITIDSSDNIYVVDFINENVQKFNSNGVFQLKFGSNGSGDGQFLLPHGIALDSSGNIYVADTSNNRFQKFTSSGSFVGWLGRCDSGTNCDTINQHSIGFTCTASTCSAPFPSGIGDGQFVGPWDIELDSSDNIYTNDADNKIQKFDSTGGFIGWLGGCDSGSDCDSVNEHSNGFSCTNSTCSPFNFQKSNQGQFLTPQGIAIDSLDQIYVGELLNGRIQKFNSAGTFMSQFGTHDSGGERFVNPFCSAVDSSGNIYVPDIWNGRIQKFDSDGEYQSQFGSSGGGDGSLGFINCIEIDSSDNIYVSDTSMRVHKFSSLGVFQGWLGGCTSGINCDTVNQHSIGFSCTADTCSGVIFGDGDGIFFNAYDLAIDSAGNFYISDDSSYRIQKFDSAGTFQGWLGKCTAGSNCDTVNQHSIGFSCTSNTCSGLSLGFDEGQFLSPKEIAFDSSDDIYVADSGNARIQKFDSAGTFQLQFGTLGSINDGEFTSPHGITIDSSDNLYVVDSGRNNIQIFNTSGEFQSKFGSIGTDNGLFLGPRGISMDSLDNIYVSDTWNNRIQKFSTAVPCIPPISGDWIITENCEISTEIIAPASVIIQNNSVVRINSGGILTILSGENLIVVNGSGLNLIQSSSLHVLS